MDGVQLHARDARGAPARDLRAGGRARRSGSCSRPWDRVRRLLVPDVGHGYILADPGGRRIPVDRIVACRHSSGGPSRACPPRATGSSPSTPTVASRPARTSMPRATSPSFPIKQGGLATQQADAVAEAIAAGRGSRRPEPFRPVLRGLLSPAAMIASCATRSPAAAAKARSPRKRCGGRRRRSPAATSPATSSAGRGPDHRERPDGSPRGRASTGRAHRGRPLVAPA